MNLSNKLRRLKIEDGFLVLGFLLVVLGVGMGLRGQFWEKSETKIGSKNIGLTTKNDIQVDSEVVIDISGEVMKPGVYKLKKGAILDEVLVMAGGLTVKANSGWVERNLNRVEQLYDGEKIYIPNKLEDEKIVLGISVSNKVIKINSASLEDLDELGLSIAQGIIDYRTENGEFKRVEEIKLVPGIEDKMFEKIKNKIQL